MKVLISIIMLALAIFAQPVAKQQSVLPLINGIRDEYGLKAVSYDPYLESELLVYKSVYSSDVIFNNASEILSFATFDYFNKYFFLFKGIYNKNLIGNIRYRVNQANCFDFSRCLCNTFNENKSCLKNKPEYENKKECSYAWKYLPQLVHSGLSKIACVDLDEKYACYGKLDFGKPVSDCVF